MSNNKFQLFPGKTLEDLFRDVYDNQQKKKKGINDLIKDLKTHLKSPGYVAAIGPVIKDLIEASVKNDDSLLKLGNIVQKIIAVDARMTVDDGVLSEQEKIQLRKAVEELEEQVEESNNETDEEIEELSTDVEEIKRKLGLTNSGSMKENNE